MSHRGLHLEAQAAGAALSAAAPEPGEAECGSPLRALLETPRAPTRPARMAGVVVGCLLALVDDGRTPLVSHPHDGGAAALRAGTTVDLFGEHIGRSVVLVFEDGDATRPIVIGLLRGDVHWPLPAVAGQVEIDSDGERMLVSARKQLVLRCGAASITLTEAGKILIRGNYVLSQSSGVNRVKGGSIQLN